MADSHRSDAARWVQFVEKGGLVDPLAEALDEAHRPLGRAPDELIGLGRRQFLKITGGLVASGFLGLSFTACDKVIEEIINAIKNRPVRRNVAGMAATDPIIQSWKAAITAMQALPQADRRNWSRQANIHNDSCRHQSWLFFPWHRGQLLYFEQICRQLSGNATFALPYWDWSANPQIPSLFFEVGSPLNHSPRSAGASSTASSASVGQPVVDGIMAETNFILFAGQALPEDATDQFGPGPGRVEQTPHNHIHGFVGGTMSSFVSPLDPIFWVHHNQIEHLWVRWNVTMGNANTNSNDWLRSDFNGDFCDKDGSDVNVSVSTLLLAPLLAYRFDTQEAV